MKTDDHWIELGEETEETRGPAEADVLIAAMGEKPDKLYPRFTIRGKGEAPDYPDGEYRVKLRKVRSMEEETREGEHHTCELEILAIKPESLDMDTEEVEDVGESLDRAMGVKPAKNKKKSY